jgi:hypothetical protein
MREELHHLNEEIDAIDVHPLMQRWKNCVDNKEQFVEK